MQGIDSGPVMPPGKPSGKVAAASRATPPEAAGTKASSLRLYNLLAKLPGPKNFAVRIFMFSFIGTQLPLFALLLYVLMNVELTAEVLTTFSIVLIAALLGSASTVIALLAYAEPVGAISRAMQNYGTEDYEPDLPEGYSDEIGELMANKDAAAFVAAVHAGLERTVEYVDTLAGDHR